MGQKMSLAIKVSIMLIVFYTVLIIWLFVPAGTVRFYDGWIYFGTFFLWTNILTFYFLLKNPELIERRTQPCSCGYVQKLAVASADLQSALLSIGFIIRTKGLVEIMTAALNNVAA